jgi:hypothetical protein
MLSICHFLGSYTFRVGRALTKLDFRQALKYLFKAPKILPNLLKLFYSELRLKGIHDQKYS